MNPLTQVNTNEVTKFIWDRLAKSRKFRAVIHVSVDKYPDGLIAIVWVGLEPDEEMQEYAAELELELGGLDTPCSILLKSERELPHGGVYKLPTKGGEFSYRTFRVDPIGDEDWVFVVSLYRGTETYRFRASLTRTLASMLRSRNLLDDKGILKVYLEEIKGRLEQGGLVTEELHEIMFSSRDLSRFAGK